MVGRVALDDVVPEVARAARRALDGRARVGPIRAHGAPGRVENGDAQRRPALARPGRSTRRAAARRPPTSRVRKPSCSSPRQRGGPRLPLCGLIPTMPGQRGRDADRRAAVGAGRGRDHPRRDGRRAAAARPARRPRGVVRVGRAAERRALGERAPQRELRQVRLADDDRARRAQARHDRRVARRPAPHRGGAERRDLARDVRVVLDRDRHAAQRPVRQRPLRLGQARSARTTRKAFSSGSRRSMRSRHASTSSRGVTSPARTRAARPRRPATDSGSGSGTTPVVGTAISGQGERHGPDPHIRLRRRDRPLRVLGGNDRRSRPDALVPRVRRPRHDRLAAAAATAATSSSDARHDQRVELPLVTLLAVVILPFGIGWWVGTRCSRRWSSSRSP